MAAGDWYYQVWEHHGLRNRVREVGTYKNKYDAQEAAERLNAKSKYYCREGQAPSSFFFVQPVLEEHLREPTAERFCKELHEDRERALKSYDGYFKNLAKVMAANTLYSIEHCLMETYWRLDDHGGWLKCHTTHTDGLGDIKSYVLYTGMDEVQLKVAIERGKKESVTTVDIFESESALKDWLRNQSVAEAAIGARLTDLFFDRYRIKR